MAKWEGVEEHFYPAIPQKRGEAIPVPDFPLLSAQLPSPKGSVERHPDPGSSFDKLREPSQVPKGNRTQYDVMTWGQFHDECPQRGFMMKASKAVLKTRWAKMGAAEEKRNLEGGVLLGAPGSNSGICELAPGKGVVNSDITTQSFSETQLDGKRERVPAKGAGVSDIPAGTSGEHSADGTRERAPAKGVKAAGNPTQLLDTARGGVYKDTLGGGKGEGGLSPAKEAEASDNPISGLGDDAVDTSETLTGKRGGAPVEGAAGSDVPAQSVAKQSSSGDPGLCDG